MTANKLPVLVILIFIIPLYSFSQFKTYEQETGCKLLYRIKFNVNEIKFEKDSTLIFYNKPVNVEKFSIKAKILVQIACHVVWAEWDSAYGYFDFFIGYDSNYFYHDRMLEEIYGFWKDKDSIKMIENSGNPILFYSSGDYLIAKKFNEFEYYETHRPICLIYNRRIIYIRGSYLENNKQAMWSSDNLLDNLEFFDINCFKFNINSDVISTLSPEDFLLFYKSGKFKKRRLIDEWFEMYLNKSKNK